MVEFLPSCNNKRNFLALILVSAALSSIISVPSQAFALPSGRKILVLDLDAGTNFSGLLFSVDPTTGARTIISDFGVGANQGVNPVELAVDGSGQILVVDPGADLLFSVDPTTGARTIISDFGVGSNQVTGPVDVAIDASGQILIIDLTGGTDAKGALFSVDPTTGARTIISDFGVGANQGHHPEDLAVDASGQILVVDSVAGTNFRGLLFSVDPTTGARTIISDFGVGANQGNTPFDVAVDASVQILVLDPNAGPALRGVLFSVDPTTGARTIISDFGVGANRGLEPFAMAIDALGQ